MQRTIILAELISATPAKINSSCPYIIGQITSTVLLSCPATSLTYLLKGIKETRAIPTLSSYIITYRLSSN